MNVCYIQNRFKYVKLLKKFIKSDINIIPIKYIEHLKNEDLLIISVKDINYKQLVNKLPNVIVWEKIMTKFYKYSISRYMLNYDFYYLSIL